MPEKLPLRFDDAPELVSVETPLHRYIAKLNLTGTEYITADIEDVSGELKLLADHYSSNANFRLSSRKIAPLVDFLTLYNPAVDVAVQSDPAPSALVWGNLKALLLVRTFYSSSIAFLFLKLNPEWTYYSSLHPNNCRYPTGYRGNSMRPSTFRSHFQA
jgi:hypothetical protein